MGSDRPFARSARETLALALPAAGVLLAGNAFHPGLAVFGPHPWPVLRDAFVEVGDWKDLPYTTFGDAMALELAVAYSIGAVPLLLLARMRRLSPAGALAIWMTIGFAVLAG